LPGAFLASRASGNVPEPSGSFPDGPETFPSLRAASRTVRKRSRASGSFPDGPEASGRTIHEPPSVPNEWDRRQTDVLTEGLVITIEPMVAAGSGHAVEEKDGWTIRTRDRSLAAHYEDTIVITRGHPIVLTDVAA
jgi:hypothetical protein